MNETYFFKSNAQISSYMVFPRFLLDYELSETTKLIYIVLLDRARLSMKNEKWIDENGNVFVYYTIKSLASALHKKDTTIKNSLKQLEDLNLIYRIKQGIGQPNKIYIKLPSSQSENCLTDSQKIDSHEANILTASKKERTKLNISNKYGPYENVLLSDTEFSELKNTVLNLDKYIYKLSNYMHSNNKNYSNHAATIKSWAKKDHSLIKPRNYTCKEDESL